MSDATLKVNKLDTSSWDVHSLLADAPPMKSLDLGTVFMACTSRDPDKAAKKLEEELFRVLLMWGAGSEGVGPMGPVGLQGVLAPPSTLELRRLPREGEIPDCTVTFDLEGEKPAVRNYAAFCFFKAYTDRGPMEYADLKEITPLACREGQLGPDLD